MIDNWPIQPVAITKSNDYFGILDAEALKTQLTTIAAKVGAPVAIVDFPPEITSDPIILDIDENLNRLRHQCSCHSFRNDGRRKRLCQKSDLLHINIFRGLSRENVKDELEKRIHNKLFKSECISEFGIASNCRLVEHSTNRIYLEYNCFVLGYKELLFPIFFSNKIFGLVFVGEVVTKNDIDSNEIKRKSDFFFNRYPELVYDNEIKNLHSLRLIDSLSQIKFSKLIENAVKQVDAFEDYLKEQLKQERQFFLANAFEAFRSNIDFNLRNYFSPIKHKNGKGLPVNELKSFWKIVNENLQDLLLTFPLKQIVFFAQKEFFQYHFDDLEIVASIGLGKEYEKSVYKIDNLENLAKNEDVFSYNNELLLNNLRDKYNNPIELDKRSDYIRILPSLVTDKSIIVLWIKHDNDKWPRLKEKSYRSDEFDEKSSVLLSFISSVYTSIYANIASNLIEIIIKAINHEVGQLVPGFDSIRIQYFEPIKLLNSKDCININRGLEDLIQQVKFIGENTSSLLLKKITPNRNHFWIFQELIYKWENSYKLDSDTKRIQIKGTVSNKDDKLRPQIYADKSLLEQVIYNILNNAVKYCYFGTKILIDCKKDNEFPNSPHKLTITNYGGEFNKGEEIYELFVRGETSTIPGLGIGLYLVNRIAKAHGGLVYHNKPEMQSPYNVPLIDPFIERFNTFSDENKDYKLLNELKEEKERLIQSNIFHSIVSEFLDEDNEAIQMYKPTYYEIIDLVRKPTYKIIFTVEIPSK